MNEHLAKRAAIAALCEHPDAEKYAAAAGLAVTADDAWLLKVGKEDLFTPDDNGNLAIDTPGFFKNYRRVLSLLAERGENLTTDDFMRPLAKNKTHNLVFLASEAKALGDIFAVDLWHGRFEDMQALWYKFPLPHRRVYGGNDGLVNAEVKRVLFEQDHKMTPEERLSKAGLTTRDIHGMFEQKGLYEVVLSRLTQAGDYMRKEYLMLPDNVGNTVFHRAAAWEKYDDISAQLAQHGDTFTAADLTREVGYVHSMLGRAAENRSLHRVFAPALWQGRLDEMAGLWSRVLEGWKMAPMRTHQFDAAFAAAEDMTYPGAVDLRHIQSKKDVLRPVSTDGVPVLPIGLASFWDAFPAVQQKLVNLGQPLTLADLRLRSGLQNETVMARAVKTGHFDDVLAVARRSNETVSVEDFMARDSHDYTLLDVLASRKELAKVFKPDVWVGRLPEMKRLWSYVLVSDRDQISFPQVELAVKQETLRRSVRDNNFDFGF